MTQKLKAERPKLKAFVVLNEVKNPVKGFNLKRPFAPQDDKVFKECFVILNVMKNPITTTSF